MSVKRPIPPQDMLRALLDYDPLTGVLTWRDRSPDIFASSAIFSPTCLSKRWNTRYAGRTAFSRTDSEGYHTGRLLSRGHRAHRVIWKWMTGVDPNIVDHINGDRTDNRWVNLRSTDDAGNARNSAMPRNNTSGHRGVRFNRAQRRWVAYIGISGKPAHIGSFDSMEDAVAARKLAEVKQGFHVNHGRPL